MTLSRLTGRKTSSICQSVYPVEVDQFSVQVCDWMIVRLLRLSYVPTNHMQFSFPISSTTRTKMVQSLTGQASSTGYCFERKMEAVVARMCVCGGGGGVLLTELHLLSVCGWYC